MHDGREQEGVPGFCGSESRHARRTNQIVWRTRSIPSILLSLILHLPQLRICYSESHHGFENIIYSDNSYGTTQYV